MSAKTKSEVQQIIRRSGNHFHSQVVRLLRGKAWKVLVSPYYSDSFTDKPREVDIIAIKSFDLQDTWGDKFGIIDVRLFIECKYINGESVFWFDEKDMERAIQRTMVDTGMDEPQKNTAIRKHHYLANIPVAKLFASSRRFGDEYDLWHKAINQGLNAMVYYQDIYNLIPKSEWEARNTLHYLSYPIIICSSFEGLHQKDMKDEAILEKISDPFQLEVNYAYVDRKGDSHRRYFLIDVVSIEKLGEFLSILEKTDVGTVQEDISWKRRT